MPLDDFQRGIFAVISKLRSEESYVAGAVVIHRAEESGRFSNDVDIFHDEQSSVAASAIRDARALAAEGYEVDFPKGEPPENSMFVRAWVSRGGIRMKMEWVWDSAFRFFPLVPDEVLGFRLHDLDAATNKALAAAGRIEARDFIDLLELDARNMPLGRIIWAASGKDPGLTPERILGFLNQHSRFQQSEIDAVKTVRPLNVVDFKNCWLEMRERAQQLITTLPPETLGAVFVDATGQPVNAAQFDPAHEIAHYGSVRGAWPRLVMEDE